MVNDLTVSDQKTKKLSLAPSGLTTEQVLYLFKRTPRSHIYHRSARGGGVWEYVTGTYIKKVLNYVFGWKWSFEVKSHGTEGSLIWVLGKLTVTFPDGTPVTKEQFGRAEVKMKRDGSGAVDFGNDLKAATTDALKKCASELGIASDIYGKNEFKEIHIGEVEDLPAPSGKK